MESLKDQRDSDIELKYSRYLRLIVFGMCSLLHSRLFASDADEGEAFPVAKVPDFTGPHIGEPLLRPI